MITERMQQLAGVRLDELAITPRGKAEETLKPFVDFLHKHWGKAPPPKGGRGFLNVRMTERRVALNVKNEFIKWILLGVEDDNSFSIWVAGESTDVGNKSPERFRNLNDLKQLVKSIDQNIEEEKKNFLSDDEKKALNRIAKAVENWFKKNFDDSYMKGELREKPGQSEYLYFPVFAFSGVTIFKDKSTGNFIVTAHDEFLDETSRPIPIKNEKNIIDTVIDYINKGFGNQYDRQRSMQFESRMRQLAGIRLDEGRMSMSDVEKIVYKNRGKYHPEQKRGSLEARWVFKDTPGYRKTLNALKKANVNMKADFDNLEIKTWH